MKLSKSPFLCLLLMLSACFNATAPVRGEAPPKKEKAFIYGRFQHNGDPEKMLGSGPAGFNVGLNITDLKYTGYPVLLGFKPSADAVYAVAVTPGQYKIGEWVEQNYIKPNTLTGLDESFQVEAGKAYYIGDYTAEISNSGRYFYSKLGPVRLRFRHTTQELNHLSPALKELPKISVFNPDNTLEPLEEGDTIPPGHGMVLGELSASHHDLAQLQPPRLLLRLTSGNGSFYTLAFGDRREYVLATLPAGTYTINKLMIGNKSKTIAPEAPYARITVYEGRATYIGKHEFDLNNGGYKGVRNTYGSASDLAPLQYKQLASQPIINAQQ